VVEYEDLWKPVVPERVVAAGQVLAQDRGIDQRLAVGWARIVEVGQRLAGFECFSVIQRKVLTPNDFANLAEVERRLLAFQRRYQQTAVPFDWRFTHADLDRLMRRLDEAEQPAPAA
jgi:hypothetical protein